MLQRFKKLFDSESKTLAKNSSWMLGATVYQAGLSFGKSVVIASALGLENYGVYALVFAFVGLFQEVFNLNFGAALIKFATDFLKNNRLDKVHSLIKAGYIVSFVAALASVMAMALGLFLFYDVFFDVEGLELIVLAFALTSSLAFFNNVARVMLRLFDKFKINSLVNVVVYTIEFAFICACLYIYPQQLKPLILTIAVSNIIGFLICNTTAFWEVWDNVSGFWKSPLALLSENKKTIAGFILNNSLSKTLQKMMKKGDVLVLAAFTGSAEVGLYDVARKLSFSLLIIKDPLTLAVYPQLAKLVANQNVKKIRGFLTNVFAVSFVPYVIGVVTLVFLSDWLIEQLYGSEFVSASNPLIFLVMAVGLEIVFFWTIPYILSLGKTGFRLRASLVSSAITLLLSLLLVSSFGATGIAVAILTGGLILQASFLWVVYRHTRTQAS